MIQATLTEMVQTRIAELKVTGHAMSAPYGHDIVCASMSTLCAVLGNSFEAITHDDGDILWVTANLAQEGNYQLWKAVYETMRQLADQYPENVDFKYVVNHG